MEVRDINKVEVLDKEDLDRQLAESFRAMQDFIEWSQWHHVTFVKPLLEALDAEVQPDFIIENRNEKD